MSYVPTTFVDRSVEFPNRRKLTAVSGLADTFDVARAEGTVFATGTKLDAANLNAEFGKIKTETDDINSSLTWKRINAQSAISDSIVEIPENATEIMIVITYQDQMWSTIVPMSLLTSNSQIVSVGGDYYDSANCSDISANVTLNSVQMRLVWINGIQKRDVSFLVVFYKK